MPRPFIACALLTACMMFALAVVAHQAAPPSTAALTIALAFVPYAGLLVCDPAAAPPRLALLLAGAAGAALALSPSVLSDDVYRYLWDARVWLSGVDPYAHAPDAPALVGLRDPAWPRINHADIPTIYPPLAQLLFALAVAGWSSIGALKLLALSLHLLGASLVPRLVLARGGSPRQATRAVYLLALNPLALSEAALGGHVDVAVGLCVLLLALAWPRAPAAVAALLVGAISGLKLVGFVLVPLLLRRGPLALLLALLLSLAALWPTTQAGHADAATSSGLGHFTQRWRGNEGPFILLERASEALLEALAPPDERAPQIGAQEIRLAWLAALQSRFPDGPLSLDGALRGERKQPRPPGVLDRAHVVALLAKALGAGIVLLLACWLGLRARDPALALRNVLLAVLLLTPQLHPWYLLWLLPLELALGRRTLIVWSAVALVAYAPLDGWLVSRSWHELDAARPLQFGLVVAMLALEARFVRVDRSHLAV